VIGAVRLLPHTPFRAQNYEKSCQNNFIQLLLATLYGLKNYHQFEHKNKRMFRIYEGWNFNSGNYLFTTDTK